MSTSNNSVTHHTSHTMENGASSSKSGDNPCGHHTSHTMGNGASSSSSGALGNGAGSDENVLYDDLQTSVTSSIAALASPNHTIDLSHWPGNFDASTPADDSSCTSMTESICERSIHETWSDNTSLYSTNNVANFSIIDSTLREGEQFATAHFDTAQKLKIAQALDDFGVEYIEVTSPVASEQSRADCEAICKLGLKAKILCHIRCNMDDARVAVQTGVDGINMCIGTSSQLMQNSHGKDMAYIEAKVREVVAFVRSNNVEVRFSGEDTFRSNFDDILNLYSIVDRLGADRIGVADTVGCATPLEVYDKIDAIRRMVGCGIETHFHNDTGCAIANAYTALEAGCTHVDCTVLGIGERNGITPLGGLVASLIPSNREYILSKYKIEKLRDLEQLVADIVTVKIPFNNFTFCDEDWTN